jgi:hypothetical protein
MYDNTTTEAERRYGWLDVATGANSSIVYTQAQFATKHGYDSILVLHLDSLEIASSVNLQSFIKAKACKVSLFACVALTASSPLPCRRRCNGMLNAIGVLI